MKLKRFASGWIQYSPSKLQPKILYSILLNGRNAKITPKIEYSFLNSWKLAALVFARLHKMKLYLALICSTGKKFPLIPIGNFLQITLIGMFVLVLFLWVYWNRCETAAYWNTLRMLKINLSDSSIHLRRQLCSQTE